jgi:3-oxoacyl-(acyl-carrier-protein) synthase III
MSKVHSVITGIGAYVPKYRLTNEELSTMVDTSDEWITQRIGIKERPILKPEEGRGVSYLAEKAIENMMSKKAIDPLSIEAVIMATTTPDYLMPNTSASIATKMGMTNAFGFDINAACSGFLYGLEVADNFIASGKYKKILFISGDVLSSMTDYTDRNTCPIFADGCGCVLIEPTTDEGIGYQDAIIRSEGDLTGYLRTPAGGSVYPATQEIMDKGMYAIHQEGRVVFKHAVAKMADTCEELMKRNNLNKEDISWVVPHQANLRIIDAVAHRMGVPIEKVMINIEKYGNCSAGTIALCLNQWEPRLKKGDNIILTAFGGGFAWGATYIKWGYDYHA